MVKKIVLIGPESTGKSSLCEQLAAHYGTIWCKEYAREYLLGHGTHYNFEDLATIAKGQLRLEDEATGLKLQTSTGNLQSSNLLFLDTDMYVMKVWCEFVFGTCHPFILEEIESRKYDLYLLCNTDLPWVKDELREYPDLETREKLFEIYKNLLIHQSTPWVEIKGNDSSRLAMAIEAIERVSVGNQDVIL
ncbi:MAG TPA: AAA family ATPase [Niabella sp.]|nr:AAA family ATPase [Niabella sp.]HQW14380.1 AAA family ATPase [Niabella sp.]HQX18341.1 AAA family ATPase [Niabella sp.]HQX40167.1 AAA family ATPase [Niabella sp.]HRB05866.1 AAA family ATPase [Niabella sp.]